MIISKVNSFIFLTIFIKLLNSGNSFPRVFFFTRKGFTAIYRPYFIRINTAIIYKVIFIIITIYPVVKSMYFNNGLTRLTGITLYGDEKIINGIKKLLNNRRVYG